MRYAVSLLLWCALTAGLAGLYQLEETAPPEERRRVLGALLRRGYSYEVISKYLT